MKNTCKRLLCLMLVLAMVLGLVPGVVMAAETDASVYDITVNDLFAPIGIDDPNPSFGWKMDSDVIGAKQTAYNIVVTDEAGKTAWDTGWVESNESFAIEYAGEALQSSTVYTVAVKIKDQNGVATEAATTTFETGLYEEDAFADTQWIRFNPGAEPVTTYTIDFDVVVNRYSMGFSFGSDDTRSMLMWQLNLSQSANARFRPHQGNGNGGWSTLKSYDLGPGKEYDLGLQSSELLNKELHMTIQVKEKLVETYLSIEGGKAIKLPDQTLSKVFPLSNWGIRAYGAKNETTMSNLEMSTYDNIVFKNADGEVLYSEDFSGADPVQPLTSGVNAATIVNGVLVIGRVNTNAQHLYLVETGLVQNENILNKDSAPVFRKEFDVKTGLKSAKLYSSALGVYENWVNGTRVGHLQEDGSYIYDELKPGYTLYAESIFYSTFDVTHLLKEGKNALAAEVTTGWWNAASKNSHQNGVDNAYFAKLILTYEDGTVEEINTDTTWLTAKAGPTLYSTGIFPGHKYDATQDTSWREPGYDDHKWKPALLNEELDLTESIRGWVGPQVRLWPEKERTPINMYTYTNVENVVYDTDGTTVLEYGKVIKDAEYKDGDDIPLKKGQTLVIDYGQNGAGWDELTFTAPAGTTITVRRGEIINDGNGAKSRNMNGPEGSVRDQGTGINTYKTATDETVTWAPYLTYTGYRVIKITATADCVIHKARAQVLSSVQGDSAFMETSDKDVNQFLSNVKWSMYSNFMHIPTDCCNRGERLGWTGDSQSFSNAALLQAVGGKSFLEKHVLDIVQSQRLDPNEPEYYGSYDQIAPTIRVYYADGQGTTGWGDAGIIIPYNLYKMYGDTEIVETVWDSMTIYMDDYLADRPYGPRPFYDDWMGFESTNTNTKNMNALSYYCWDARMMAEMALAIGKPEDAQKYQDVYAQRKQQYIDEFVAEDGKLKYFSQCGALYALYVDLLPNEESVAAVTKQLVDNIEACGNKLQTGFLGTTIIMQTLTKIGRTDIAYKLLLQHENPSWLFAVDNGATTVWERWNTYSYEVGYPTTSMASMNHYWTGTITAWMYQSLLGLGSNENGAGYQHMTIAPHPDRSLPMIKGTYDSAYGPVSAKMEYVDLAWNYDLTLPANTDATIKLPLEAADCVVTVNGKAPEAVTMAADGIEYVKTEGDTMIFNAVAGIYSFTSERDLVELTKDETNAALDVLKLYQHTAAVTEANKETVTAQIAAAEAAVEKYVSVGGKVEDLTGYEWIAGAKEALTANADFMVTNFTVDFDFIAVEDCSQIAFGVKDTDNLLMWQLNMRTEDYNGQTMLRPHVKTNGNYGTKTRVDVTNAVGMTAEVLNNQRHMRIEVTETEAGGAEIKTYLGTSASDLTLAATHTHATPVTLYNLGFRSHSANVDDIEVCKYDNILIKGADGEVLYYEDFSDPSTVAIGGTSNATDYSFVDGWLQIGNGNTSGEQIYILGRVLGAEGPELPGEPEPEDPKDLAKAAAEQAVNALKAYQSTVSVTDSDKEAVRNMIANAKTAVAAYVELGGSEEEFDLSLFDGAEAALVADALYQTDSYTIDLTTNVISGSQGFAFHMSDVKNFIMWQLNLTNATTTRIRPHIQLNGGWKTPSQNNIDVNAVLGAPSEVKGKTFYERIEVNGTEIKTYFGFDPDNMVLANTFTHNTAVTLEGIGARVDTTGTPEIAIYDDIVIKDGNGNLIYSEDFSDPTKVAITGNANATAYAFVDGALKLGSESKLTEQRYRIGKADAFAYGVELTETRINAIGEVTLDSLTAIEGAREAYNVLTDAQKAAVPNYGVLTAAEDAYEALLHPVVKDVTVVLEAPAEVNGYEGDMTYTVSAKNMVDLATVIVSVDLSEDLLTDPVAVPAEGWSIVAQTWRNGELNVALANMAGADGDGVLFTITATPVENAEGTASAVITEITLSAYEGEGETWVTAIVDKTPVTTVINTYSVFDVNRDGIVDQLDMTRAQRYFGLTPEDIDWYEYADVNNSDTVDIEDLILILNNYHEMFE